MKGIFAIPVFCLLNLPLQQTDRIIQDIFTQIHVVSLETAMRNRCGLFAWWRNFHHGSLLTVAPDLHEVFAKANNKAEDGTSLHAGSFPASTGRKPAAKMLRSLQGEVWV